MYSQNDLDEAVASGAVSAQQANALRAFVEQQRATPAVDEEQFRLINPCYDLGEQADANWRQFLADRDARWRPHRRGPGELKEEAGEAKTPSAAADDGSVPSPPGTPGGEG